MADIAFILHGRTKNRTSIFSAVEKTLGSSHRLKFFVTEPNVYAVRLAELAVSEGFTHIVSIGGDGTLNEVANGLMKAKESMHNNSWKNIRMGCLPMGTGNDFIKTLNVPANIQAFKEVLEADRFKTIDLGLVEFRSKTGELAIRYFINITDVGMGGLVAEKLSRYSRWMGPLLTYQRAILSTLLTYKSQTVNAQGDSFAYDGEILNFIVANGKYFGSGLGIAPHASIDDGQLSIVVLGKISLLDYIKLLSQVRQCKPITHPAFYYTSAKELRLYSPSGPLPIDMDGEFIGYSPMKVSIVPGALRFLCL